MAAAIGGSSDNEAADKTDRNKNRLSVESVVRAAAVAVAAAWYTSGYEIGVARFETNGDSVGGSPADDDEDIIVDVVVVSQVT